MHHAICEVRFAAKDGRPIIIVSSTSKSTGKVIESYLVTRRCHDTLGGLSAQRQS